MITQANYKVLAITTSTALLAHEANVYYYTTCALNMSGLGHVAITASGTPKDGTMLFFICNLSCTNYSEGVNDLVLLGRTIPAELSAKTFVALAAYTSGSWKIMLLPNWGEDNIITSGQIAAGEVGSSELGTSAVESDEIAANAVLLSKIVQIATSSFLARQSGGTGNVEVISAANARTILNVADGANNYVHPDHTGDVTSNADGATTISNGAIDPEHLAATTAVETWTIPISFESTALSGGVAFFPYKAGYDVEVQEYSVVVTELVEATDDATVTLYNHSGNLMGSSSVTVTKNTKPDTSAPGTTSIFNSSTITSNYSISGGQKLGVRCAKTTAGGRGFVEVKVKRV